MKNRALMLMVALMVTLAFGAVLINCGGGGGGGGTSTASATGTITGKVVSNLTGSAISGASVTDGTTTVATAADGTFTLSAVPPVSRKILTVTAAGHAMSSRITQVVAGVTSRVDVAMLPIGASLSIASLSGGASLSVPSSPAQVNLPANSLARSGGAAPAFPVTANLTPLDPSANPQLMPGDFTTSAGGQIESFGAMEVSFKDSTGATLNLASGQTATIRIPVAAVVTSPAATIPAFYYNTSTGQWVQEGVLTLGGTAPNQYYEGTVTHFSYWNADQVYNTTCITGKVVDASGNPMANARVETQGRDYVGTATAYTAANGTFTVSAKANSTVIITASTSDSLSNSEVVSTGAAGGSCTALTADLKLGAIFGGAGSGSAKIRLTWGSDPRDLDSHLTGPDLSTGLTSTARFHVYYWDQGSLTTAPYAELDVDDTTSFGPEVITISRFSPGTYRYSVHHYSGTGTLLASPARVELTLNGSTTIYTPPTPGITLLGTNDVWQVFELVVASNGAVTVNTLNTYQTGISTSFVTKPSLAGGPKPPMVGGDW